MNILIEDAEKLEYLTSDNHWTKKASEGKTLGQPEQPLTLRKKN